MVPRPGTVPARASAATRRVRSSLIAAAVALPSRITAVIGHLPRSWPPQLPGCSWNLARIISAGRYRQCLSSVEEVTGAGEVQADPLVLRGLDDLVVADRSARLDDRAHPGTGEHLQAVGEGEERVAGGRRPDGTLLGPAHREPGRVDPVDLAHADPDGGTGHGDHDG